MKKLIVFLGIVCLCCFFYKLQEKKQVDLSDLVSANIECLAQNEGELVPVLCLGIGDLDCNGEKVKKIISNIR